MPLPLAQAKNVSCNQWEVSTCTHEGNQQIWMNRVLDVRIYLFWNLDAWGHSKIIKDYMDEGKTPLLLGKIHETMGVRKPIMGPLFCPKMSCFCFMVCIYVFHTYLIDFSFLKIENGSHSKLPTSKPSHWLHELFIFKTICHHFQLGLIPHYKLGVLIQVSIH
jgi:hypothetical protein